MELENVIYMQSARTLTALERSAISDKSKKLILAFVDYCLSTALIKSRLATYSYHLIKMARWPDKDFDVSNQSGAYVYFSLFPC